MEKPLVDELLKQSGTFRANQEVGERVMDSNDIEKNVESLFYLKIQPFTMKE